MRSRFVRPAVLCCSVLSVVDGRKVCAAGVCSVRNGMGGEMEAR